MFITSDKTKHDQAICIRLVVSILLLIIYTCSAQAQAIEEYMAKAGDHASLFQGRLEPIFNQSIFADHPYLFGKEHINGDVCFKGTLYKNVGIRYNIYDNLFCVVTPERKLMIVPDQSFVDYFVIQDKKYVRCGGWFVAVEYDGKNAILMNKQYKEKGLPEAINNTSYNHLRTVSKYYILSSDGTYAKVNSLKDFVKAYPQLKNELKSHCKKNKLKWSKECKLQSMMECAALIDEYITKTGSNNNIADILKQSSENIKTDGSTSNTDLHTSSYSAHTSTTDANDLIYEVPAYDSFIEGGTVQYNNSSEDIDEAAGISTLNVLHEDIMLKEIEIMGFNSKAMSSSTGMEKFRISSFKNVPLALGESDVIKLVQTLPGVKSMGEVASGFNVRGSAADQNLILLNNNTLFNPMHMFGLFSAFNSDIIGESTFYKSTMPAEYGGRLASAMNLTGKVADKQHFHGNTSIGLLTSKASFEIPIIKNITSLLIGGRTTYSDWILKKIPEDSDYMDGKAGFWDLSGTLSTSIARHNIKLNGYYSQDKFSFTKNNNYAYRNANASAEWRFAINDKLATTLVAGYDHYDYMNEEDSPTTIPARLTFAINQIFARAKAQYELNDSHKLTAGVNTQHYSIMPGKKEILNNEYLYNIAPSNSSQLPEDKALESAIFIDEEWKANDNLKISGGIRLNYFKSLHEQKESTYFAPDFRLTGAYTLNSNSSMKLGINNMHQFIHKVSNTIIMSPTDTWMLSNKYIKPQNGFQISAEYAYLTDDNSYEFSAEIYYKHMNNYLTYRGAGELVMNPNIENDVSPTQGRAYGIELSLHKNTGKLTGWMSYCYSRTQLHQTEPDANGILINNGNWFNADHDRPHEFKLVGNYKFTQRYSMSLNTEYSTGRPITIPVGKFLNEETGLMVPIYTERNAYRMPFYLRTDLAFNIETSHHITNAIKTWFSFGVYNLFGRKNPYSVYYQSNNLQFQGYKISVYGCPIPFINFNIKF